MEHIYLRKNWQHFYGPLILSLRINTTSSTHRKLHVIAPMTRSSSTVAVPDGRAGRPHRDKLEQKNRQRSLVISTSCSNAVVADHLNFSNFYRTHKLCRYIKLKADDFVRSLLYLAM
jgi:hypothetical protein